MCTSAALAPLLRRHQALFGPVLPFDLNGPAGCRLDFTAQNPWLTPPALADTPRFAALVTQLLDRQQASVGVGGYLEDRVIYRHRPLFTDQQNPRSVHLGVDLWAPAGTLVLAPLAAMVHALRDNAGFGNYGPTVILRHELPEYTFYTLYGHLSRSSLPALQVGQLLAPGQAFAALGPYPENGDWPPHLHFQIITDLRGYAGDFPGVCSKPEAEQFAQLCPDPNLILQCRHLDVTEATRG